MIQGKFRLAKAGRGSGADSLKRESASLADSACPVSERGWAAGVAAWLILPCKSDRRFVVRVYDLKEIDSVWARRPMSFDSKTR